MNIYSIYKITNRTNNKVYIGFSTNPHRRFKVHLNRAKTKPNIKFYDAMNKYGIDCFEMEIIYQSLDYDHCKNIMEDYFITEYNSIQNGYNMKGGGDGTPGLEPWNKGKKLGPYTPEYKAKMAIACKGINSGPRPSWHIDNVKMGMQKTYMVCQHCGLKCNKGGHTRWHGDNCKLKPQPGPTAQP